MLNMLNVCRCFSSIFSNQLITSVVFLHLLSCRFSHKQILILSNIDLVILTISFLVGFINLVVGWLAKFSLWSFKVIRQLLVPVISILSDMLARFAYVIPSLFIISPILLVAFLYVYIIYIYIYIYVYIYIYIYISINKYIYKRYFQ